MYNLNPLRRNVLITGKEVLVHAPTSQTVDIRQIDQAIIIAEERFVKKSICKDLYEEFRTQKNKLIDAGNKAAMISASGIATLKEGDILNALELVSNVWYKNLWNEYLWKICAECVIYTATPTNFSEYTSQGEMINNPKTVLSDGQGAVSASAKETAWKMDKLLMDRIDPLIASMHEWICDNKINFPKYTCKACSKSEDGVSYKRKSGWINAYSNTDLNTCQDD